MNEIVIEDFGSPEQLGSPLEVNGQAPLTGTVRIKNNKLSSGTKVYVGFVFGGLEETGDFWILDFPAGGAWYYWGTYKEVEVPSKGNTKAVDVETYALNIDVTATFDIYVWVGPTAALGSYSTDYGSGNRKIGITKDFDSYESNIYDSAVYLDQVTVSP